MLFSKNHAIISAENIQRIFCCLKRIILICLITVSEDNRRRYQSGSEFGSIEKYHAKVEKKNEALFNPFDPNHNNPEFRKQRDKNHQFMDIFPANNIGKGSKLN